jgi:hypothetical protein
MAKYAVIWTEPFNSVQKRGPVRFNGLSVFDTIEQAMVARDADMISERDYNPDSQITWEIVELPRGQKKNEKVSLNTSTSIDK